MTDAFYIIEVIHAARALPMAVKKAGVPVRAYTIPEFVDAFRLSRATVYKLLKNGELRSVVIGGFRLTTPRLF